MGAILCDRHVRQERPPSPVPTCVSMKSDRSNDRRINFQTKDGTNGSRQVHDTDSCRFHGNVPKAHYSENSVFRKYANLSRYQSYGSPIPRQHKAHFSDSPLFRNCEYSNVKHYCPHAHPNESHHYKNIRVMLAQYPDNTKPIFPTARCSEIVSTAT